MKINNYIFFPRFLYKQEGFINLQPQMRRECSQIIVDYIKKGINILIFIPYSLGPNCEFSHGWGLMGFFQRYNQAVQFLFFVVPPIQPLMSTNRYKSKLVYRTIPLTTDFGSPAGQHFGRVFSNRNMSNPTVFHV